MSGGGGGGTCQGGDVPHCDNGTGCPVSVPSRPGNSNIEPMREWTIKCFLHLTWFKPFVDFLLYSSSLLSRQLHEVSILTIVAWLFAASSSSSEARASLARAGGGDASRVWSRWLILLNQYALLCVATPSTMFSSWLLCHFTTQRPTATKKLGYSIYAMFVYLI